LATIAALGRAHSGDRPNLATGEIIAAQLGAKEAKLCSETTSLLLNLLGMTMLLAILFRLSSTFTLIANTQRELRRAIYHLSESRRAELRGDSVFDAPGVAFVSRSAHARSVTEKTINLDDVVPSVVAKQVA
jgi:hypothetical protein